MLSRICCIDDNQQNLMLLEKALSKYYEVFLVDSPERALERIYNIQPDVILLDINMPEINGYEICKKIRSDQLTENIPVIFVSCLKELEDRLEGYEVGGDAYVTKPYNIKELLYIIRNIVNKKAFVDQSKKDLTQLQSMSLSLIKNNSELGELLKFSSGLAKIKDEEIFVERIFRTLTNLGLNATLLIKLLNGEIIVRTDQKPFTLIEKELLDLAQNGPRISSSGTKFIFCGESLTLLIKNMPIEDDEFTGRLKDHLCVLLETGEASIEIINAEKTKHQSEQQKKSLIRNTIKNEFEHLASIAGTLHDHSVESVESLAAQLEEAILFLDLTEEQENKILSFVEVAHSKLHKQHILKDSFQASMSKILTSIAQ